MSKFLRCAFFCIAFLSVSPGFAQTYNVQFYVEKAYFSGYNGDEYGPRIRLYKYQWKDEWGYALWLNDNCIKLPNIQTGWLDVGRTYSTTVNGLVFDFGVVTHEERKASSDDCTSQGVSGVTTRKPDRYQAEVWKSINLNDYAPGVYSPSFVMRTVSGSTYVDTYIKVRYTPVAQSAPNGNAGQNCSNENYTLTAQNAPGYESATNTTGLTYKWQYTILGETVPNPDYYNCLEGCTQDYNNCLSEGIGFACDEMYDRCTTDCSSYYPESLPLWRDLTVTDDPTITFNPLQAIFNGSLTASQSVAFRLKAVGAESESAYSASSIYYQFVPPPPDATTVTTEPSCPLGANGIVHVSGVTSQFSTYRYILKQGNIDKLGCNPDTDGSCLSASDISGSASGGSFDIPNVKPGTYTLFLLNNAGTEGFCPRRVGVYTVPVVADLKANFSTPQNLACNGINEGAIAVTISDGKYSSVTYDLLNQTTNTSASLGSTTANATVTFDKLSPGSYRLTVSDGCTPTVTTNFDITQPVKVSTVEFQKVDATCTDPGNGTAKITVSKSAAPDVSVSSVYTYQIYKDGTLYNTLDLTAATYTWTGLPVSADYKIIVKEKDGLDCNGAVVTFAIGGPAALGINTPLISDVTCYNGANGAITVSGTGGTGNYIYELSGTTTLSNATGEFTGLIAGDYVITVRNTITCNDKYVHPTITISQPTQVTATISGKDISCYGLTDGEIYSNVTGGTPSASGYRYTWETQIGSSWSQLSATTPGLTRLREGTYRLKVKDDKECPAVSNEVSIAEPGPIGIAHVQVNDIKCLGETGNIAITGSGGTGAYTFAYSVDDGVNFKTFDASTPLTANVYQVRIADVNGCKYTDPGNYAITEPSVALSFTETLSDYNGYTISCYGGSNGTATLAASGGNGASYSGYTYAADNGEFQQDPLLTGIYAGDHSLKVQDGRGCVVSKTITFTQTSARLAPVLVEKKNVTCYGDVTGILEYTGDGGLPPYQFNLNNRGFQDQGRFTGLAIAEYTIVIKDKNGCDNSTTDNIVAINPKIEIATSITDVSCFGGNDGAIVASVTGGVAPFQYQWSGAASTAASATGLTTGDYTVTVTDHAGCKMQAASLVQQPLQALRADLTTVPVCYGRTNGSITATIKGGTAPYQYSIDNGATFQTDPVFIRGVGNYTITSKDSKGCLVTASTSIIQRNDKPEPNFLVATTRNARDTLVIIDVSVPKPDSIYWVFDPQAIVISNDQWSPQLRFLDAGTYFVSMTGYFAGCDYSVTKNMTVSPYDPDIEKEKLPGYKPIQSVSVTPNPSTGNFELSVTLSKKYNLSVLVYDVLGNRHYENTWDGVEEVKQSIELTDVSAGVYLLRVITESDAEDVRILINK